jgi:hypothetical protein
MMRTSYSFLIASPLDSLLDSWGAAAAQLVAWLRMRCNPGTTTHVRFDISPNR